jgi:hypothetical protein
MKNYIGGVKIDQGLPFLKHKCPICGKIFICHNECNEFLNQSTDFEGCFCGKCLINKGNFQFLDELYRCKSRFPDYKKVVNKW